LDATVTWNGNLSFSGAGNTGFTVPLDADPGSGGNNNGFRPLELMAISLAGCTAMDVISILQKKKQVVTNFEVRVHADQQDEHPHIFTHIYIEYIVTGRQVSEEALRRSIELSETKYCPAQAMLAQCVEVEHSYQILEAI
jgi:putative redox protein